MSSINSTQVSVAYTAYSDENDNPKQTDSGNKKYTKEPENISRNTLGRPIRSRNVFCSESEKKASATPSAEVRIPFAINNSATEENIFLVNALPDSENDNISHFQIRGFISYMDFIGSNNDTKKTFHENFLRIIYKAMADLDTTFTNISIVDENKQLSLPTDIYNQILIIKKYGNKIVDILKNNSVENEKEKENLKFIYKIITMHLNLCKSNIYENIINKCVLEENTEENTEEKTEQKANNYNLDSDYANIIQQDLLDFLNSFLQVLRDVLPPKKHLANSNYVPKLMQNIINIYILFVYGNTKHNELINLLWEDQNRTAVRMSLEIITDGFFQNTALRSNFYAMNCIFVSTYLIGADDIGKNFILHYYSLLKREPNKFLNFNDPVLKKHLDCVIARILCILEFNFPEILKKTIENKPVKGSNNTMILYNHISNYKETLSTYKDILNIIKENYLIHSHSQKKGIENTIKNDKILKLIYGSNIEDLQVCTDSINYILIHLFDTKLNQNTFDISNLKINTLPTSIGNLKKLNHLYKQLITKKTLSYNEALDVRDNLIFYLEIINFCKDEMLEQIENSFSIQYLTQIIDVLNLYEKDNYEEFLRVVEEEFPATSDKAAYIKQSQDIVNNDISISEDETLTQDVISEETTNTNAQQANTSQNIENKKIFLYYQMYYQAIACFMETKDINETDKKYTKLIEMANKENLNSNTRNLGLSLAFFGMLDTKLYLYKNRLDMVNSYHDEYITLITDVQSYLENDQLMPHELNKKFKKFTICYLELAKEINDKLDDIKNNCSDFMQIFKIVTTEVSELDYGINKALKQFDDFKIHLKQYEQHIDEIQRLNDIRCNLINNSKSLTDTTGNTAKKRSKTEKLFSDALYSYGNINNKFTDKLATITTIFAELNLKHNTQSLTLKETSVY